MPYSTPRSSRSRDTAQPALFSSGPRSPLPGTPMSSLSGVTDLSVPFNSSRSSQAIGTPMSTMSGVTDLPIPFNSPRSSLASTIRSTSSRQSSLSHSSAGSTSSQSTVRPPFSPLDTPRSTSSRHSTLSQSTMSSQPPSYRSHTHESNSSRGTELPPYSPGSHVQTPPSNASTVRPLPPYSPAARSPLTQTPTSNSSGPAELPMPGTPQVPAPPHQQRSRPRASSFSYPASQSDASAVGPLPYPPAVGSPFDQTSIYNPPTRTELPIWTPPHRQRHIPRPRAMSFCSPFDGAYRPRMDGYACIPPNFPGPFGPYGIGMDGRGQGANCWTPPPHSAPIFPNSNWPQYPPGSWPYHDAPPPVAPYPCDPYYASAQRTAYTAGPERSADYFQPPPHTAPASSTSHRVPNNSFQELIYDSWREGPRTPWPMPELLPDIPFPNGPFETDSSIAGAPFEAPIQELLPYKQLLTSHRECYVCHKKIHIPRYSAGAPTADTHVYCSDYECSGTQCLGCSKPHPQCATDYMPSARCPALSCCSEIRVMRIFSILGEFESHYFSFAARACHWSGEVERLPRSARISFIYSMNTDQQHLAQDWNRLLRECVEEFGKCLLPEEPANVIHASVQVLLSNSLLHEAMYAFLETASPASVSDEGAYAEITRFLGILSNRLCLEDLVRQPQPAIRVVPNISRRVSNPSDCVCEIEGQETYSFKDLLTSHGMLALVHDLEAEEDEYLTTVTTNLRQVIGRLLGHSGRPTLP